MNKIERNESTLENRRLWSAVDREESEWEICRVCGGEMDAHAPCLTFPSSKGVVEFQHMKCPSQENEGVVVESVCVMDDGTPMLSIPRIEAPENAKRGDIFKVRLTRIEGEE